MEPDPSNPLAPDNREIEARLLNLRPTFDITREIEATYENDTPENKHLRSILEIELHDADIRDELQRWRPVGCWCLGMGGREAASDGEVAFWRVTCTCPEGIAARIQRQQLLGIDL